MLRFILISLVVFLIVRAFVITGIESRDKKGSKPPPKPADKPKKGVPRELGEYIEFEEMKPGDQA